MTKHILVSISVVPTEPSSEPQEIDGHTPVLLGARVQFGGLPIERHTRRSALRAVGSHRLGSSDRVIRVEHHQSKATPGAEVRSGAFQRLPDGEGRMSWFDDS